MIGEEDNDPLAVERAANAESSSGYNLLGGEATPYAPAVMSDMDVLKAMGRDPQSILSPTFKAEAAEYRQAAGRQQAIDAKRRSDEAKLREKISDPSYVAQQAYGRLGNIGAARVISKSTGPALFQHGEEVNLGKAGRFYMAPGGYLTIPDATGKQQRISAEKVIQMAGVSVIPFLGGDEAATEFRKTTGRISSVMEMLDQLEDIYDANGNMAVPLSDGRSMAKQIESQLPTAVQQIKSGSNSSAGISDYETKAILDSIPRRTNWDTLGDQEKQKLNMVRTQLRRLIIDRATRNGIEFREIREKSAPTGAPPQAQGSNMNPISGLTRVNGTK